ncbi:hypothetical protein GCM10007160_42860 [Litchfieldella qijiaojingensis]|uniref:Transcriptional regulator n=1 Tax=Litchfieldella qijiaojingensis TaxID=980347 RepID=A0ABQ2ZEZ8_9GAMM|nr:hypothetical protein [Halomonas qijiaojingensis]GGY11272.1 hypothetical protein GCM10007160_42860 [Halomonas qijiaojingensis]
MKPKQINRDQHNDIVTLFHSESDRGAAVLSGSYVENVLGNYLRHKMTDKSLAEELFNTNGPLSTFSQRIAVAQAYGFITRDTGETLNYIRKIRNHFAHHPFEASFNESPVRDWTERLKSILPLREDQDEVREEMDYRQVYLISCAYFCLTTQGRMGDRGRHE